MDSVSRDQLSSVAAEACERWHVPGLAVGVLHDGEVISAADGLLELGKREAVTPATVFRVASITKPFVATLALTLVQNGLLSLEAPPPGSAIEATVGQLLSHQGGLASEWPERLDGAGDDDEALIRLAEAGPERLPVGPGELFSYSNAGFWIVGGAIAKAAGMSFEEAMRAGVLEPLGLGATGFGVEADERATGHKQVEPGADEHRPVEDVYPRVRRPSGGLWSSVDDLLRFAAHHLGGPGPLTAESIAEMQRPRVAGPGFRCGLGWFVTENRGRPAVEHAGSAAGYQSLLVLVPNEQRAFVGLANSSRGGAAIRDVLEPLGLAPREAPDVELRRDALAAFAGRYHGQGVELEFVPENGGLRVELTELDPFSGETQVYPSVRARPIGAREFEIADGEWRGERFDFPRERIVCMGSLAVRVE
jgi:CubicO group peptidase (beta-lactamase class C family)